jgi:hypothetical protein
MQNTKGGGMPKPSGNRDDMHSAIVADLASVIAHVRKSLSLIEQAVASEAAVEEAVADNIIVLDDITPGYARANAVLRECDAGLSLAVRLLQGSAASGDTAYDGGLPQAHWPISA